VVGIHNAGSSIINHATRINDAVFQQIKDWRAEGG
jgi:V8-like Glu-specific endopeptidase